MDTTSQRRELQINQRILTKLEEVLEVASMKNAGFRLPAEPRPQGDYDELKGWYSNQRGMINDNDTMRIRLATDLWRQSWIIRPLQEAIAAIKQTQWRVEVTHTYVVTADSPAKAQLQAMHAVSDSVPTVQVTRIDDSEASNG